MASLRSFVVAAIEEIRNAISANQNDARAFAIGAPDGDGTKNFAPAAAAEGDAAGDATLALRSSNEEPRSGSGSLLPGTARTGPGTHRSGTGPVIAPAAEVFIDTDDAQGILGDVDWDVLAGGDAAVRILGDDGRLTDQDPG